MRRGAVPVVVLCLALAGTACRPVDQQNTGDSAPTAPAAASTAPTGAPSSLPPVPSASPTGTPAPGVCATSGLTVSLGHAGAGAGHRGVAVVFGNSGSVGCYLRGYPRVVALDASGRQVASATHTPRGYLGGLAQGHSIGKVTLAPGGTGSAYVEGMAFNPDGTACTGYRALLVTPPGGTSPTRLDLTGDLCSGLQVHPVVSGSTGHQ
ncbi:MAG: DUF4232 domain-containing protein [Micromonosporaceae bacterium]|nr:DUF4232 domain-containing protein [Micromonosporaceae bacterium]